MYWIIVGLINFGDVVLDLFFGIGIIGVVVKMLGCDFIGIECEVVYCEVVEKWLSCVCKFDSEVIVMIKFKCVEFCVFFG